MNKPHSFKLGYNTNSWGRTPNLDEMFNDIAQCGWKGVELISLSLDSALKVAILSIAALL